METTPADAHDASTRTRGPARPLGLTLGVVAVVVLLLIPFVWSRYRQEPLADRAGRAIGRALEFLGRGQLASGEVPTYAWRQGEEATAQYVRTPFTASQVLHSLTVVDGRELARGIRRRAEAYLLFHREAPGVWRYYGKDDAYYAEVAARFQHPKLPPDVDDTAQAWAALSEQGHRMTPEAIAALRATRTADGLFATWIARPEDVSWMAARERDADLVVNLNALFALARAGQPLAEVCDAVVAATRRGPARDGTVWYRGPLVYAYALTRAYADGPAGCLAGAAADVRRDVLARQRPDGSFGDDLETAAGTLALLNTGGTGPEAERGIQALLARQAADGGWAMAELYRGGIFRYGSRELTTAIGLEAVGKYLAAPRRDRAA